MPVWLEALLGISAIVGPALAGYFGAQRGMAVGLAVHEEKIADMQREIVILREVKHVHSQRLTEHEAYLAILKQKAGIA